MPKNQVQETTQNIKNNKEVLTMVKVQKINATNATSIRIQAEITGEQLKLVQDVNKDLLNVKNEKEAVVFKVYVGGELTAPSANAMGITLPATKENINVMVTLECDPRVIDYTAAIVLKHLTTVVTKAKAFLAEIESAKEQIETL